MDDAVDEISDTDEVVKDEIFDLEIVQNEKNVLSCHLTFKTENSQKPTVRYFLDSGKGYEIKAEGEGTDHRFFLWGMKAEKEYEIEIYLNDSETPLKTAKYTSGKLPDTAPQYDLRVNNDKVSEGFLLFTTSATIEEEIHPLAIMVDTDGDIVWYFEYYMAGFSSLGDIQYIKDTETILISVVKGENMVEIPAEEAVEIDLAGNTVWKSREYPNIYYWSDESWHHIYNRLPDDTLVMLRRDLSGTTIVDKIVNLDRDYNVLWEWRYLDHYEVPECDPADWCDWTHCNWVVMKKEEKVAYLNSRNLSKFYKIDMETGDVKWTLGKGGDFTFVGENPDQWFEFAHAPKVVGENNDRILFYDNGSWDREYSRVVEYTIDEVNMVAQISYVYHGFDSGNGWFTDVWGDVDYLPGGNMFVTAGTAELHKENRLFEITRDGEMAWELVMKDGDSWNRILYNSEKFIPSLNAVSR